MRVAGIAPPYPEPMQTASTFSTARTLATHVVGARRFTEAARPIGQPWQLRSGGELVAPGDLAEWTSLEEDVVDLVADDAAAEREEPDGARTHHRQAGDAVAREPILELMTRTVSREARSKAVRKAEGRGASA